MIACKFLLVVPFAVLMSTALVANAAAADEQALEEVVVTAQKRSELLGDVPLSITAATADQLTKQGIKGPEDLGRIVPSLSSEPSSFGPPLIGIRGVEAFSTSPGMAPSVTVYVDQIPLPYLAMTSGVTLDLDRLEVLKGPQGTLFGQNSTGGAINYIAAKPTRELRAGADLTYGRFDEVDLEGFVSGPLTDTLSARVAGRRESRGDWQVSQTRPGDQLGKRDFEAGRFLLDWTPSDADRLELNFNAWKDKSDTRANQYVTLVPQRPLTGTPPGYPEVFLAVQNLPPAPANTRIADWDANPYRPLKLDQRFYQASVRGDFDLLEKLTLTSISAYSDYTAVNTTDADGTSFDNLLDSQAASIYSFSQELRLAGDLWTGTKFTLGLNYQHDTVNVGDHTHFTASTSGVGPLRYEDDHPISDEEVKTKAAFAALDYSLTDSLTAQAAARYTTQNRDFRGCLADGGDGRLAAAIDLLRVLSGGASQPLPPGACLTMNQSLVALPIVTNSLDQHNVSWRAGLSWKPQPDTLVYANVTKGYKAGDFQALPAVFAVQLAPVRQESVLSYEAGIKASLANLLQVAGAVYYSDYRDKQSQGFIDAPPFGNLPINLNIPKSSIKGAELEVTALPLSGLRLTVGASYVQSRIDDSFMTLNGLLQPIDVKGEPLPNTPKWHLVSDAEYDRPLGDHLSAFLGGGVTYRTSTFAIFGENALFEIPSYALVDLRAGIQAADDKWRVELWGRNVLDRFYLLNTTPTVDVVARTAGMPATYGISVRVRY